ncbi:MAG: ECF-type sigma factor [Planctomycetaceae bacterium]|nr:ECF-type sigma factor [Planctomycetaceae bacterium]
MASQITQVLDRITNGNRQAVGELVPLVYDHMRQIASGALRREPDARCDPTELVHEAYIRLIGNEQLAWESRSHFFAACAVVIRRLLVDQARARQTIKRGGHLQQQAIDMNAVTDRSDHVDLIALDDALRELEGLSPRQARLVELRFFGGLTEKEAASVLDVSLRTLSADWSMARAWLKIRLS